MAPLLLLLVLVAFLVAIANAFPASCSKATCAGLDVQYPFWLISSVSDICGYRGLGLACENNASLILSVQGHRYRVVSIDYNKHIVAVADAELDEYGAGCPRLHSNFTVEDYTGSWLQLTPSDSNITFLYNCKKNVSVSAVELSGCRGRHDNKTSYVLPDGVTTGTEAYKYECEEVVVAPVPSVHKAGTMGAPAGKASSMNGSFGELVKAGFELCTTQTPSPSSATDASAPADGADSGATTRTTRRDSRVTATVARPPNDAEQVFVNHQHFFRGVN